MLAVLWLIAVLSLAVLTTVRVVSFDMDIATARVHGFRAREYAEMGIAVAANPAVKKSDPLLRRLVEGEGYEARIISEGGRFNINALLMNEADRNLLRSIFISWGLKLDEADEVVDALGDWIDTDDNSALHGAEKSDYDKAGRINQPFNRPFYSLEEMRMVRGMDQVEALRPDWQQWFTVWSGGQLDVNEAPAELIAEAAEVNVGQASELVEQVVGPDGVRDTEDDKPFQKADDALALLGLNPTMRPDIARRLTANDSTVRIISTGISVGAKRRIHLVLRNRTGRPTVLERTEEIIP